MFDVDGTNFWFVDEVLKRLPSEARKKLWGPGAA